MPTELQGLPAWVGASREPKTDKDGNLKSSKVPINPKTGANAKSSDPKTWGTFEQAVACALNDDRCFGVGINLLGSDYVGLDLDHVIDGGTGELLQAAEQLLHSLPGTYTERSPSGTGLRLFYRGKKPSALRASSIKDVFGAGTQIEIYDGDGAGRYLTATGDVRSGAPLPITTVTDADLQPLLDLLPQRRRQRPATVPTGARINGNDDLLRARWALLDVELLHPDAGGYHGWLRVLAALKSLGDHGLPLAIDWSRRSSTFDEDEIRRKWSGLNGSSIAALFGMLDDAAPDWRRRYRRVHRPSGGPRRQPEEDNQLQEAVKQAAEIRLGEPDPNTGKLVLSPRRTLPTAEVYIAEFHSHRDGRTLHSYAGQRWSWRDNHYVAVEDESLTQQLHPWLHEVLRPVYNKDTRQIELVPFDANPSTVNAALQTIRSYVHLAAATLVPSWLDKAKGPPAIEIMPFKSGSLHVPTMRVLQPTPLLFNTNALDFDFDPAAPAPKRWLEFLDELVGTDTELACLLQEWFGYSLTPDTSHQKMLLLVGPRRSGKGTIGRVITKLVGAANVVGPTIGGLAGNFGLQPLLGKSLAVVSDARFTGDGLPVVVERLLCISGEDALTVDRKFATSVTMKLPTRFMFLTNELPRFNDASTALAGRFLVLQLTKSFYGRENVHLVDELLGELPGILLWALEGWRRLHDRGHFHEPAASREAIQDIEDLSSPVSAFVRDRCIVAPGHRVNCSDLYRAWCDWCTADGRSAHTTAQVFGRDLAAAVSGVARRRCTGKPHFYEGIGLAGGTT